MNYRPQSCITLVREMGSTELACPKPCRASANGFRGASDAILQAGVEAGHEILEILFRKTCSDDYSSNDMNPHMYESPPTRASNPLVHDVQFNLQKKKLLTPSPLLNFHKFAHDSGSDVSYKQSFCDPSDSPKQPLVRIEGFSSSLVEVQRSVINFS